MVVTLRRGLLLLALSLAAGEAQEPAEVLAESDQQLQGCDATDDQCVQREELQNLELLQTEVRLHSDLVLNGPAKSPSKPAVIKPELLVQLKHQLEATAAAPAANSNAAPGSSHAVKAAPKSWDFRTERLMEVDEQIRTRTAKAATVHPQPDTLSLVETTAVVHHRNLHMLHRLMADTVSGNPAVTLLGLLCGLSIIVLCGYLLYPMFLNTPAGEPFKQSSDRRSRPAASQLLEAPQTTTMAQSPIMASLNRQLPVPLSPRTASATILPPICPSLILPHTEARFMIPIESIKRAQGELDIRGTSGRKLLSGAVTDANDGRRCLSLASVGCDEDPRVTVVAPAVSPRSGTAAGVIMELYGKGGQFYGTLEPAAHGGAVVRCKDELVMSLETGKEDLRMTASSMDGRLLATAGQNVAQASNRRMESNDTWKLQVKPNYDAVLISACMLGVLLFGQ